MDAHRPHRWGKIGVILMALILMPLSGCGPTSIPFLRRGLPPTADRLVGFYGEDLATRRFQVLAHFEDPVHTTLFRREPDRTPAAVGLSTARARHETGAASLSMTLTDSSQRVVMEETPGARWGLRADWSAYQLLLLSVYSPRDQGAFRLRISSGADAGMSWAHPRSTLRTGWNLLRIDLGDVAEQINIADVRRLEFWCDPLDSAIELFLDDLILADNSRELFASRERESGDLYARSSGRRIVVGAVDRFELVFSRGQIREWRQPSGTAGGQNLAAPGGLGPFVASGQEAIELASGEWTQAILEANPLRLVLTAEPGGDPAPAGVRWVYAVYADGRVFYSAMDTQPAGPGSNLAFACDPRADFRRTVGDAQPGDPASTGYALLSRPAAGLADLLIVPDRALPARNLDQPDRRIGVAYGLPAGPEPLRIAGMLQFWPDDVDGPSQAAPAAASYVNPMPLGLDVGRLVRTDPGDLNNDGYSEGGGYYALQLDGRIAKLRIDGRRQMRFSPAFKLLDVAGKEVWAYADGRQIRSLYRDQDNNVFFQVPGVINREVLVEINSSAGAPKPSP